MQYNKHIATKEHSMQSKQAIYTANIAKAKLMFIKKRETYVIKIAFNVNEITKNGQYKFPAKCDFVSGEFNYETFEKDKQRIITQAKKQLRTDLIEFV
jgi:hypothetical protein